MTDANQESPAAQFARAARELPLVRTLFCEGCGKKTSHELQPGAGEWEHWHCRQCANRKSYRTG